MSIEVVDIDSSAARTVLATEENHFNDVKAKDASPAKLTQSMSAFANADGGELFIGVAEHGRKKTRRWIGFKDPEDANGHIQAFEAFFPLSGPFTYQFLRRTDNPSSGLVLKASIAKTRDIREASNKKVYVRRGAQNLPITTSDGLQRLEYAKGVTSFETHPVDAPLDYITNSETVIEFMLSVVPEGEPEAWLKKQLLIRDGRPTVASILLFADEPQAALPKQSAIKLYRYATSDDQGTRATMQGQPQTIEGSAYRQIYDAVARTASMVEGIRILGPDGMEDVKYPEVTLHEVITNAVLHRDYSISDDIHVRVFDNRVEVESPGPLPAHLTPENILQERASRNGAIVRWINKFPDPPNKDVGEGLRAAFDAMRSLELKAPVIADTGASVKVSIRHERLASPEEIILEYLSHNDEISNRVVRRLTGIGSENRVKRIFQSMINSGELESIPGRSQRYAAYRLPRSKKA